MDVSKELTQTLYSWLAEKFEIWGFIPHKELDRNYYRDVPIGKHAIHLSIFDFMFDIRVQVRVAARYDAIAELFAKYDPLTVFFGAFTVDEELGIISGGKNRQWRIRDNRELLINGRKIVKAVEKVGLPYLERFKDLEVLLEYVSKKRPYSDPVQDAKTALAAALLLKRRELFDRLIEEKTLVIKNRADADFYLPGFITFSEYLAALW